MTKAILLIWLGFGQTQTMSMTVMDSLIECEAAKAAMYDSKKAPNKRIHCIPYVVEDLQ